MARSAGKRQAGASLLEALVALFVLATATLGTLAGFSWAVRASQSALLRTRAVDLAAEAAEQLRAQGPGALPPLAAWQTAAAAQLPQGQVELQHVAADADRYRIALHWPDPIDQRPALLQSVVVLPTAAAP